MGARRLAEAAALENLAGTPTDTASPEFLNYLITRLGSRREECVLILFLTGERVFIAEDLYLGGRRTEVRIPLRRTVRRAFDLDARRVILAHNHPSGTAKPSASDIAATRHFATIVEALDIVLDDHCVVAGNRVASMRGMKLI